MGKPWSSRFSDTQLVRVQYKMNSKAAKKVSTAVKKYNMPKFRDKNTSQEYYMVLDDRLSDNPDGVSVDSYWKSPFEWLKEAEDEVLRKKEGGRVNANLRNWSRTGQD